MNNKTEEKADLLSWSRYVYLHGSSKHSEQMQLALYLNDIALSSCSILCHKDYTMINGIKYKDGIYLPSDLFEALPINYMADKSLEPVAQATKNALNNHQNAWLKWLEDRLPIYKH